MVSNKERKAKLDEHISLWAIRRKLFIAYFAVFSILFVLVTVVAVWLAYEPITSVRDLAELVMRAMNGASGQIAWIVSFSLISVEVGNVIFDHLILERRRRAWEGGREEGMEVGREEGREEGRVAGKEEGREVGREEGREEVRSEWQAWYKRLQEAQREGRAFNEPPPGMGKE